MKVRQFFIEPYKIEETDFSSSQVVNHRLTVVSMFWEGEAGLAQVFPGHSSPCGAPRKSSRRENLRSAVSAGEPGEGDESRISSCRENRGLSIELIPISSIFS